MNLYDFLETLYSDNSVLWSGEFNCLSPSNESLHRVLRLDILLPETCCRYGADRLVAAFFYRE
jgi:hypothetical protein